jgi:hypothetical protein
LGDLCRSPHTIALYWKMLFTAAMLLVV